MSDTVVRVQGVGKQFRIGSAPQRYRTLRDSVTDFATAPFRKVRAVLEGRATDASEQSFWALKNVSFEVQRGEVIGILGRNGAGKSTLLKILSRITPPTSGRIGIKGRVGSLLEVGSGFHPELTGRDNVYLNGAILGMRRAEIARKFDAIVDFAEVAEFIDTPVKHYSSGMYMRLAFAVAAHMEPQILIVDEVLAVGDVAFQKKCLGKMEDVSQHGRTVLFVSHNMQAVRALCQRCVLLHKGEVVMEGRTAAVVASYQQEARASDLTTTSGIGDPRQRRGSGEARFNFVAVEDAEGKPRYDFRMSETVRLRCRYEVLRSVRSLYFYLIVWSPRDEVTSVRHPISLTGHPAGHTGEVVVDLPELPLRPGEYRLLIYLNDARFHPFDTLDGMVGPLVVSTDRSAEELGFNPSSPNGTVSIPSVLRSAS